MTAHRFTSAFSDLPFGEQFLLWAVRLWVEGHQEGSSVHLTLQNGFKLAGAPDALAALDDLMTVIAVSATDSIDIRCPQCGQISIDEHTLMDVIAGLQQFGGAGSALFASRLPATARRIGMDCAERLARNLAEAGLSIRPRRPLGLSRTNNVSATAAKLRSTAIH